MNSKQWEYTTGWPETKSQRDTLHNALLEKMLEWGGRSVGKERVHLKSGHWEPKSHAELRFNLRRSRLLPSRIPARILNSFGQGLGRLHPQTQALIIRDGMNCHWCGRNCIAGNANSDLYPTRDHRIRRADGGTNGLRNLVLACRQCNNSRHANNWKPPVP